MDMPRTVDFAGNGERAVPTLSAGTAPNGCAA